MKILFTILLPLFFTTFSSDEIGIEERHPDWVKEIMDRKPSMTKITQCFLGDEPVWKVNSCVTCSDMITYIYDWDKKLVCEYGGVLRENSCRDNEIVLEDCRVIYKPKLKLGF